MFDFNKPKLKEKKKSDLVEAEFNFYLSEIKEVMNPALSFLELGPGKFSLSDYFPNVTIIDNDFEILKKYAGKKRRVLCGDYHSISIGANSFDYVIALHPNIANSEKNIEWVNPEEKLFRFKKQNLEDFVSSLIDIAHRKVFFGSKEIAENPPKKEFVSQIVSNPFYFVLYTKSEHFDPYNLNKKPYEVEKWNKT